MLTWNTFVKNVFQKKYHQMKRIILNLWINFDVNVLSVYIWNTRNNILVIKIQDFNLIVLNRYITCYNQYRLDEVINVKYY